MPAQVPENHGEWIIMLNRAFNDTSPSNSVFLNQITVAGTTQAGIEAFAQQFGAAFAGLGADALSTRLLGNLGVLPNPGLQSALKEHIVAAGVNNVGIVALQLGLLLSGLENATGDQAVFSAAAVAWNKEVTAGCNHSANAANTSPSGGVTTVQLTGVAALADASWVVA